MKLEFGPQLLERFREQQVSIKRDRRYYWSRGDYSGLDGNDTDSGIVVFHRKPDYRPLAFTSAERYYPEQLFGIEEHLRERITTLLNQKKGEEPAICLDLGAMRGLSWARLAIHFQQEVLDGNLVFITTSLSQPPPLRATAGERQRFGDLTKDEVAMLKRVAQQGLVQQLYGTAAEIKREHVTANNRKLPLRGNVDIVYESASVTAWSKVPDLDILHVSKLLSPYGTYYIRDLDTIALQPAEGKEYSHHEEQQRLKSIAIAFRQLESVYGLQRVYTAEEGKYKDVPLNYCVFRQPGAPKIKAEN